MVEPAAAGTTIFTTRDGKGSCARRRVWRRAHASAGSPTRTAIQLFRIAASRASRSGTIVALGGGCVNFESWVVMTNVRDAESAGTWRASDGLYARGILRRQPRRSSKRSRSPKRCRRSPSSSRKLLVNPAFVAETFSDDTPVGKRELLSRSRDSISTCSRTCRRAARPASRTATAPHGRSTATRGTLTEMTEWRRVNPESEDARGARSRRANTRSAPGRPGPTART